VFFRLHPRARLGYGEPVDGNPDLVREIRRDIEASGGRITFGRFMELALYHAQFGYYTSRREAIGKRGDFFTSVSVGPLFGKLLAKQFLKYREELGRPAEFEVVEFGGHRGQLRADVLAAAPDLRCRVIEAGDPLPDSIVGCVFSNEFLDALPVHLVQVKDSAWQEVCVRTAAPSPEPFPAHDSGVSRTRLPPRGEGRSKATSLFEEVLGPLSTPRIAEYLSDLPAEHMEGYRTEVNLRALDWLSDVAKRLKRGWIVTIDYGYERPEYFAPHHRDGTLLCYHQHTKSANPYTHVGEQDITAHVEFTSFIEHGKTLGFEPVLFIDQSHYLLQIGEAEIAEIVERTAGQPSKERAAIHQLMHPELMGRTFKVLVQRKGV
jgi:SAM-dependent MidA family methyltransferase